MDDVNEYRFGPYHDQIYILIVDKHDKPVNHHHFLKLINANDVQVYALPMVPYTMILRHLVHFVMMMMDDDENYHHHLNANFLYRENIIFIQSSSILNVYKVTYRLLS
jgi:hypothetical protein